MRSLCQIYLALTADRERITGKPHLIRLGKGCRPTARKLLVWPPKVVFTDPEVHH